MARALADPYERSVHLHTDDFWKFIRSGMVPPYLPEADEQNQTVVQVIRNAALAYSRGGFVVVVDGVIGPWMLDHFRDIGAGSSGNAAGAGVDGFDGGGMRLHYVVLRPSKSETLRRAQARKPPALVEEEPLVSMWTSFAELAQWERHVSDTTRDDRAETLSVVRDAVESGQFVL